MPSRVSSTARGWCQRAWRQTSSSRGTAVSVRWWSASMGLRLCRSPSDGRRVSPPVLGLLLSRLLPRLMLRMFAYAPFCTTGCRVRARLSLPSLRASPLTPWLSGRTSCYSRAAQTQLLGAVPAARATLTRTSVCMYDNSAKRARALRPTNGRRSGGSSRCCNSRDELTCSLIKHVTT